MIGKDRLEEDRKELKEVLSEYFGNNFNVIDFGANRSKVAFIFLISKSNFSFKISAKGNKILNLEIKSREDNVKDLFPLAKEIKELSDKLNDYEFEFISTDIVDSGLKYNYF